MFLTCFNMLSRVKLKQVRCYRISIVKFINAYSGKIVKVYQRYRLLLPRDNSGLGGALFYEKIVLSLKYININNKISFKAWERPWLVFLRVKTWKLIQYLKTDQMPLKNNEIWLKFYITGSKVLRFTPWNKVIGLGRP